MDIIRLDPEKYRGHSISFAYDTQAYYDVSIAQTENGFQVELARKPLAHAQHKRFVDTLFEAWLESPEGYGIIAQGKLIAAIILSHETWNNRLRVADIWVDSAYRRQGLGKKLMDKAKAVAMDKRCRGLILETQSCNVPAIDFYRSQGFVLAGLDAYAYHDDDMQRGEVRLEWMWFMPRAER